jgi:hypothetical protein
LKIRSGKHVTADDIEYISRFLKPDLKIIDLPVPHLQELRKFLILSEISMPVSVIEDEILKKLNFILEDDQVRILI